jgi:hypothetical protein
MHMSMDRAGILDALRQMSSGERAFLENDPIATFGDLHCVSRARWRLEVTAERPTRAGAAELEFLQVFSVDAGGLVHRIEQFEADRLHLALARAIELYADLELSERACDVQYRAAAMIRSEGTQWHDEAVLVDHRPAGLGTLLGRQAISEAADALRAVTGSDTQRRVVDVLGFVDQVSLLEMVTEGSATPGGPFELSVLSLNELDDDALCIRQDWYSPDQVDEALERFDLLVAGHVERAG